MAKRKKNISESEHRSMETSKAKFKDKEDLWENIKRNNLLCVTGISEGEEREHGAKKYLKQ